MKNTDYYKVLLPSKELRRCILSLTLFLPIKFRLIVQFRLKLWRPLNLKAPLRFTEKLQVYKLTYRNSKMLVYVDKYAVKIALAAYGYERYLARTYYCSEGLSKETFDSLPNRFVIKATNGSGGENVIVCSDKPSVKYTTVRNQIKNWSSHNVADWTGEWAYSEVQKRPRILVEELLGDGNSLKDYKFFCFSGRVVNFCVDFDRYTNHTRNFYDLTGKNLQVLSDVPTSQEDIELPGNFSEMVELASKLSREFPFVRVDLYDVDGRVYFGEFTFYPWSGYVKFSPDEFDFNLGNNFKL